MLLVIPRHSALCPEETPSINVKETLPQIKKDNKNDPYVQSKLQNSAVYLDTVKKRQQILNKCNWYKCVPSFTADTIQNR